MMNFQSYDRYQVISERFDRGCIVTGTKIFVIDFLTLKYVKNY